MTDTNYFDSSALVKRYLTEVGSDWVQTRCNDPAHIIALADIGRVEIAAAFASKRRGQFITQVDYQKARAKFISDAQHNYQIVPVTSARIDEAIDLTARHRLRGYDAVHLACALYLNHTLLTSELSPLVFITADTDLLESARIEGLVTENPNLYP